MDDTAAALERLIREEEAEKKRLNDEIYGWETVSYPKRNRKTSSRPEIYGDPNFRGENGDVFQSIKEHPEDRRRKVIEARMAFDGGVGYGSDSDPVVPGVENGEGEAKKVVKVKKPKKPKVTVTEAAAKIDAGDLGAFLVDITDSYESQQDIQLMRFADYFGRAFASVSAAQFPWLKIFKEYPVSQMVDIPISHITEDVYKTSVDWLNKKSAEALGSFVLWSLDSIFDFASHQGAAKGSKKAAQHAPSSKSQVAIFMVLAMTLRRKPDVLINLMPIIRENLKCHGQDKIPFTAWVISQASRGDLVVGLYMWVHILLPMLSSGSGCNPQSRDLILQSVERILSVPKARPILLNGAVRKGERLVPPSALELLMRVTFPVPSARVKATERVESIYPTLKEVALDVSPGSKASKQITPQILDFTVKAAGEGVADLSREASKIFIWCLTQNPECYKQWDIIYLDNIDASIVVLKSMSDEWKNLASKHPTLEPLMDTLKSFRQKNEKVLSKGEDAANHASLKDADKYCKLMLDRLSQGNGCAKGVVLVSIAAVVIAAAFASQNMQ